MVFFLGGGGWWQLFVVCFLGFCCFCFFNLALWFGVSVSVPCCGIKIGKMEHNLNASSSFQEILYLQFAPLLFRTDENS